MKKIITNGKDQDSEKLDLRDALFDAEPNPFRTKSQEEFDQFMAEAGIVDLQQMAVKAGISASGGLQTLRENLKKAFARYISPKQPIYASSVSGEKARKDLENKINRIMSGLE